MEKYTRNSGARWQGVQRIVDNVRSGDLSCCNTRETRETQSTCSCNSCNACNTCNSGTAYTADTFPLYRSDSCPSCTETACNASARTTSCCHGQTYHVEGRITLWPEYDTASQCNDSLTWDVRCRRDNCT